jgi:uncharacterized protein (DUF433 family)
MGKATLADIVVRDPGFLGGDPFFRPPCAPLAAVFENLAAGLPLDVILDEFPTLDRADVTAVVEQASHAVANTIAA